MREIKFRGKRPDNGEWVYGGIVVLPDKTVILSESSNNNPLGSYTYKSHIVCVNTIGQFTGLTDKHGKRVFEGDIVSVWRDGSNRKFCVKWREIGVPMYILYPQPLNEDFWHCRSDMQKSWEIIGNIHDNPELLK